MNVTLDRLAVFDRPHQIEPLVPTQGLAELVRVTRRVFEKATTLRASSNDVLRQALREVVRSMNSYYSNLIEGQGTHPASIERALHDDFSSTPDVARRQRLALAHIEGERELEGQVESEAQALRSGMLVAAHRSLYGRLTVEDRTTGDGRVVMPGELRGHDVLVGRHQPPAWASLPAFLGRMDDVYGRLKGIDPLLYTIASAHHRAMWVHPFEDGNGRAVRLQTHAALFPITGGLWSVNRGLARDRARYYAMLDAADSMRRGDLDGRGNLSEAALREWCLYFLGVCEDQVDFMARMLDLDGLKERLRAWVMVQRATTGRPEYREEAILSLQVVAVAGPLSREAFSRTTGLGERTARKVISQFLQDGVLASDGHRAELRFALPLASLNILFPNLYPEAAAAE